MNTLLTTFSLFGVGYFIYFVLAVAIVLALVLTLRKLSDRSQNIAKISLISAIGLFVILEYIGRLVGVEQIRIGNLLPLEIFDVFAGISLYFFFSKKSSWKKFGYLVIAPISLYSIIFVPNMYMQMNTISLGVISFYILNALLIANSILYMLWNEEDLEKKDILISSMNYVIIVCIAHLINVFLRFTAWGVHANYLATMGEDFDLVVGFLYSFINIPLLCLLPLVAVLVGVEFLLILPFDLIKTKKDKQSQIEELIALGNLKEQQEYRKKYKTDKSQILVRSSEKAMPKVQKDKSLSSTKDGFVTTTKEVKVNNEVIKKEDEK